jgi:hypothetical protein
MNMIENKKLIKDPLYYKDWDEFKKSFPQEAIFIFGGLVNLCENNDQIIGKSVVKIILDNLSTKFKNDFKKIFPEKNLAAVLGIGLWKAIDKDKSSWKFEDTSQEKKYTKTSHSY